MPKAREHEPFDESSSLGDSMLVGEVFRSIPTELIYECLSTSDRSNRRLGKFPDHLVVYYVIFMCLFMHLSYAHVFEKFQQTFSWLSGLGMALTDLSEAAITQARQRVGFGPLEELFRKTVRTQATRDLPGGFFGKHRLVVLDGTVLDTPDTPENAILGWRDNQNGRGACPQVRLVCLAEYATRIVLDLEIASFAGNGEVTLAKAIAGRLESDCLVMGDRGLPGSDLCKLIVNRGSHFLFRVKSLLKLTPIEYLADGSYTANLTVKDKEPLLIRVIEYVLESGSEKYRLVTSLLDASEAPALALAQLYPSRWTAETIYSELKNVLKSKVLLRSKSPKLIAQEVYGLFIAHFVVRHFMLEAARRAEIPPDRLSFRHSVEVIRTNLPKSGDFSP